MSALAATHPSVQGASLPEIRAALFCSRGKGNACACKDKKFTFKCLAVICKYQVLDLGDI